MYQDSIARSAYLIKKHLNSSDEIDREEFIEPHETFVKDRNTQTPIRLIVSEGVQYEKEEAEAAHEYGIKGKHHKLISRDAEVEAKEIEDERLPFSTIKK
jgi:hypothetical protein